MRKKFELKAHFHIPGKFADGVHGVLKFSRRKGIDIELFGAFNEIRFADTERNKIIQGFTSHGKKFTLLDCYLISDNMGVPGFRTSVYAATYLFIGEHFNTKEEIQFDSCSVKYADFNYWLDISGFEKVSWDDSSKEAVIKYKQPEKIVFTPEENWEVEFDFIFSRPFPGIKPISKAKIKQLPVVTFNPLHISSFDEYWDRFASFNSFLALNYFIYPVVQSVTFHNKVEKKDDSDQEYKKIQLFTRISAKTKKYKEHTYRDSFLLRFNDYTSSFETFIKTWFLLHKKAEATMDILTEYFMKRNNYIEANFLNSVQALEDWHRKIFNNGAKDIYLKKRIEENIQKMPEAVKEILLSNEGNFSTRVAQNRNYFTHYDKKKSFTPASLNELFVLSEKLQIILITNILLEMGFSNDATERIIVTKSAYLFNHLVNLKNVQHFFS